MSNDTIRAAITAALRRRGTIDDLDASPSLTLLGSRTSTASVVIYGADGAVVDVVARASDDAKALRGVAFAVGMRVDPCPACNGRGRRAYGRETEDGCDECECSGVVANDPAEEVERWRNRAAFAEGEISAALGLPPTMGVAPGELARVLSSAETERDSSRAEIGRLRAELAEARETMSAQRAVMTGVASALRGQSDSVEALSIHDLDLRSERLVACLRDERDRLDDVARGALEDLARVRSEFSAMREAVREYLAAEDYAAERDALRKIVEGGR